MQIWATKALVCYQLASQHSATRELQPWLTADVIQLTWATHTAYTTAYSQVSIHSLEKQKAQTTIIHIRNDFIAHKKGNDSISHVYIHCCL